MNNKRISYLDNARALCMLWVVGIYHMRGYLGVTLSIQGDIIFNNITIAALGTFTFLSAFFLRKKQIKSHRDILLFYKKRLVRVYPFFLLSSVLFLILRSFTSVFSFITCLLGVCPFFEPVPITLWFISMLLFFYFLTPIILYIKNTHGLLCSVIIPIILFLLMYVLNTIHFVSVDRRWFIYFPIYFCTLLLSKDLKKNKSILVFLVSAFILFIICIPDIYIWAEQYIIMQWLIAIVGIIIVVTTSFYIDRFKHISNILSYISYGSMVSYLFHRQFFGIMYKVFGRFSFFSALIFCIILLVFSFGAQKTYDFIINHCMGKTNHK